MDSTLHIVSSHSRLHPQSILPVLITLVFSILHVIIPKLPSKKTLLSLTAKKIFILLSLYLTIDQELSLWTLIPALESNKNKTPICIILPIGLLLDQLYINNFLVLFGKHPAN
jgi:hypothetical protein